MSRFITKFFTRRKPAVLKNSTLENEAANDTLMVTNPLTVSNDKMPLILLRKFAPIRDLNDDELQKIEQSTDSYAPESVIFILGQKSDKIYYLLNGTIEFTSNGGHIYQIDETSSLVNLPINSGKIYGSTAVTKSPCTLLVLPIAVLHWWENESKNKLNSVDFSLPKEVPNTPFFNDLLLACRENKLKLPILPQIAIRLRKAMLEDIGIEEAVKIIQLDAVIVMQLIKLANSVLYASWKPVTNCHDAVYRLGLHTTCQLVMSISVKQLFQTKSPAFMLKMKHLWQRSVYTSSMCFVLAQESGVVNPEDALLAGLICDIGSIPLLNFAENHGKSAPSLSELQSVMPYLNPSMGAFLLHQLAFSNELSDIPRRCENWYYESGQDALTLIDVVILAKFHSYLGTDYANTLPSITSIPAYTKLENGKLNSDFSLDVLTKAKQRINIAMAALA